MSDRDQRNFSVYCYAVFCYCYGGRATDHVYHLSYLLLQIFAVTMDEGFCRPRSSMSWLKYLVVEIFISWFTILVSSLYLRNLIVEMPVVPGASSLDRSSSAKCAQNPDGTSSLFRHDFPPRTF